MPMKVKNLFKILVKKANTKIKKVKNKFKKKKKASDVHLEYLQICKELRSRGMVSLREYERDMLFGEGQGVVLSEY